MNRTKLLIMATLATTVVATAGCASDSSGSGSDGGPDQVDFMVHTEPGGGSDLFARGATATMADEGLITQNSWTVVNENGGSGASAMAKLAGLAGQDDTVAVATPTWQTTPLTVPAAAVTVDQLTPIAQMATEPTIMAVAADGPYDSMGDFIDAARKDPGGLVQTGGSVTAIDALAGDMIMDDTGTDWEYLSFEGGGERITALLNGDADMMFAAPAEVSEQVRAGKLKVIATIGERPSKLFPDAPTLSDEGIDVDAPQQLRGIVGPPEMPDDAVDYYQGVFKKLSESSAWKDYCAKNGIIPEYADADAWKATLDEQNELLTKTLDELGLLADD